MVAKPTAKILRMAVGEQEVLGIRVKGVKAYHDTVGGRRRGEVVMYRVEVEGIAVAHLGDLGHVLGDEHVRALRPVDVLLIPVGGVYTIGPREAWENIKLLEPHIVIPMHYWVEGLNLPLKRVDEFLQLAEASWSIERVAGNEYEVRKGELPHRKVVVLSPL